MEFSSYFLMDSWLKIIFDIKTNKQQSVIFSLLTGSLWPGIGKTILTKVITHKLHQTRRLFTAVSSRLLTAYNLYICVHLQHSGEHMHTYRHEKIVTKNSQNIILCF